MTDLKMAIPVGSPSNSNNNQAAKPANKTQAQVEAEEKAAQEAELEAPYYASKKVVISSVRNYSAYRRINMHYWFFC